jgi:hypothetical protein
MHDPDVRGIDECDVTLEEVLRASAKHARERAVPIRWFDISNIPDYIQGTYGPVVIPTTHKLWRNQKEYLSMRDITVKAVANGWVVTVGCQTFAYTSVAELATDFISYLQNPTETEKRILAKAYNYQREQKNGVEVAYDSPQGAAQREEGQFGRNRDVNPCLTPSTTAYEGRVR